MKKDPNYIDSKEDLVRVLTSPNIDENDKIIEIEQYIGRLCKHGDELQTLSKPQCYFYINQIFEMEVNNGGISQYFFNSGQYANETLLSLRDIGAEKTAVILESAINKFPEGIVPQDDEQRQEILDAIEEEDDEIWDSLEDSFYEYADNLNELNLKYVEQNLDSF